jgi:class 3 adenylate cyclase/tetratricopeptide (TPR) repeat protein
MSSKVTAWLNDLELGQYSTLFEDNAIDWDLLPELDQETLKDIGIGTAGHRLRILKAATALTAAQSVPAPATDINSETDTVLSSLAEQDSATWSRTAGERKPVTMLFADVVGSTNLTEKLDAEEAHELLYRATQLMCEAVEQNNGTVCRFMGDGIMAMFGAPLASERHALEACRAAVEMQAGIASYAAELKTEHAPAIQIRVGLNSGEVVVLEVGDDPVKPEYDASGPTVPLAARMEQSAEAGSILITAATRSLGGDLIITEERPPVTVKGISDPVPVFQLHGIRSAVEPANAVARHPFVGRKIELSQFRGLLAACLEDGHGHTVYLRGEAGIGKSRLVEEVALIAEQSGLRQHKALVLDFGAGKGQEAVPFLVRSLLGISPGSSKEEREAALQRAEDGGIIEAEQKVYLLDLLDLAQSLEQRTLYDAMNAEMRAEGKRAALSRLLESLAEREGLLIVVEDLHWADEITLEYLASLAATVAHCPALMIMTSRAEGDPIDKTWRARSGDSPIVTWDLGPLRTEESMSLVSGFIDANDDLAKRCIERAAGNPLFLEQLVLSVSRDSSEGVPDSIKSLVLTRVDQLPAADKQALQAASVLGQRFKLDCLRYLIDDSAYDCGELIDHHLMRPEGPDYLFAHALIQEGAYASLLKRNRIQMHRRAADWFAQQDAILYAEHLDQADSESAPRAYLEAARQQTGQYRLNRALQLVRRGLEIATDEERHALFCLEGELLRMLGDLPESIEAYKKARDFAAGDIERCHALLGMAEGLNIIETHEELFDTLREVEELASANQLVYELACIHQIRGGVYFFKSQTESCLQANSTSLKFAREAGSAEIEARALSGLGDAEYGRGRYISAYTHFDQCIDLARKHGLGRIIAANMSMRSMMFTWLNDLETALNEYNEAQNWAVRTQNLRAEMINQVAGSYYWTNVGELDKAEQCLLRSDQLARRLGSRLLEGVGLQYLSRVKFIKGENSAANDLAMEAVGVLRESESGLTFRGPAALGVLALVTDDPDLRKASMAEAEKLLAAGSISHNYFNFYEDGMEASLRKGEWDLVGRYARALEDYTRDEPLPRCDFFIARGRALAAHGRGKRDEATMTELKRLYDEATRVGLKLVLPSLEAALALK